MQLYFLIELRVELQLCLLPVGARLGEADSGAESGAALAGLWPRLWGSGRRGSGVGRALEAPWYLQAAPQGAGGGLWGRLGVASRCPGSASETPRGRLSPEPSKTLHF